MECWALPGGWQKQFCVITFNITEVLVNEIALVLPWQLYSSVLSVTQVLLPLPLRNWWRNNCQEWTYSPKQVRLLTLSTLIRSLRVCRVNNLILTPSRRDKLRSSTPTVWNPHRAKILCVNCDSHLHMVSFVLSLWLNVWPSVFPTTTPTGSTDPAKI